MKCKNDFNIKSHIPGENIKKPSGSEITVAFSGKSNFREFNSKNPMIYKGDTLAIFDGDKFYSETYDFLEPICVGRPYHPLPFISITDIENKNSDIKDQKLVLFEVDEFPKTLEIKLDYNGTTNQRDFFKYEEINMYYYKFSERKNFNHYNTGSLKPNQDGDLSSARSIEKDVIFGDKDYFKREINYSVKYPFNYLGFYANCSLVIKENFHLKSVSFNGVEVVEIIKFFQLNYYETLSGFKLSNNAVIYDVENPKGILECTYNTPFDEVKLAQDYDYIKDKIPPPIRYYYNKLSFKANCSKKEYNIGSFKTVVFNDEEISISDDENTTPESIGNFTLNENFIVYNDKNLKGKLKCIFKLQIGEVKIHKKYEYFENITLPHVKYSYEKMDFKANCSLERNEFTDLKTILFNGKIIEVKHLQKSMIKEDFKLENTSVDFMNKNPNVTLYCIYSLTFGDFTASQEYEYIKDTSLPDIVYPDGQLYFFPNCSVDRNNYTHLNSFSHNNKIIYIEGERNLTKHIKKKDDLIIYKGENPNGTFVCTYKIPYGEIELTQNYYTIKNVTLSPVIYSYDQLNFNPSCSKEEKHSITLKTIIFNDKSIDVGDIKKAVSSSVENLKLTKNSIMYEVKNPNGKLVCVYNLSIGIFRKSQKYVPIKSETLPNVQYYYNKLDYNPNCTLYPNNFTTLKAVTFGVERVKVRNLQQEKDFTRRIFMLEKGFVKVMSGDSGTLTCFYGLPVGEISISQTFEVLNKNNGHYLSLNVEILLITIFKFIIIRNLFIITI
uniref:Ig-like domain-containing protein n=1 Tax=Strongyloides venezuelensis TaxID=75913 RepID=A0A0K0FP73_STRVS